MNQIIGIIIISVGFIAPWISQGKLIPVFFYWIGFLIFLYPKREREHAIYFKQGARIGLICHVLLSVLTFILYFIIINYWSSSELGTDLLRLFHCIADPISELSMLLFPYPTFEVANGFGFKISFFRASLEYLLATMLYISLGGIITFLFRRGK